MRISFFQTTSSDMQLILAPMQGLVDDVMRDLLTRIGGYDECVSEFVRI
ncbi:MAG: tRNA-dihydrouridine synthase, partial [Neisseria sp.]|nr:tRNA-dihydrouridine synthase [Neisseria sp.]